MARFLAKTFKQREQFFIFFISGFCLIASNFVSNPHFFHFQKDLENSIQLEEIKIKDPSHQNGVAHNSDVNKYFDSSKNRRKSSDSNFDGFFCGHRFLALLIKNFIRMWRNIGFLAFQFLIPVIQVRLIKQRK
jgi:hypothetical protein